MTNLTRRTALSSAAAEPTRPLSASEGGVSGTNTRAPGRIEGLAGECFDAAVESDRAAEISGGDVPQGNDVRRQELLDRLTRTPAVTARDFAAKISAHARLLGIESDADCMTVIEASLIRDAEVLLAAPAA